MFEMSQKELQGLGAQHTTAEIRQEPALWLDTVGIYEERAAEVEAFLTEACGMGSGRTTVVLAGAGSSDYVSDTVAPYLRRAGDTARFDFKPVATTDIVSAPLDFVNPADPTILVSFARSGNSPESLAAARVMRQVVDNVRFLNITCAPEGRLTAEFEGDPHALTILLPGANDKGFAMTGSYSCMQLMCALIFDTAAVARKAAWVEQAAKMGEEVVAREDEVAAFLSGEFNRVTYLGSGALSGLAQEAQLKILELAHGLVATSWDSAMGYRHGPKSFVDAQTLVFAFVSNDDYTRQYDLDILREIDGDGIARRTIAVQQDAGPVFEGASFSFTGRERLPEVYLALPFAMVAQTVGLLNAVRLGNSPDTPNPSGTVNRVVKGVTIHPWEG